MKLDLSKDIETTLEIKGITIDNFSSISGIPRRTIFYNFKNEPSDNVLELIYSAIYSLGLRLAETKSEILEENQSKNNILVYHGSKNGIEELTHDGSRKDCDFGPGLYLTRQFTSARSFIETSEHPSIYAFELSLNGLNVIEFECELSWMLAICYYRGKINQYKDIPLIKDIITKIEESDVVIAPIADNKMFEIINRFANDEITTAEAMHALSASRLGKQYVLRSKKSLNNLIYRDRFYICKEERKDSFSQSKDKDNIIQSKLDYAKYHYRNQGKYLSEILNENIR